MIDHNALSQLLDDARDAGVLDGFEVREVINLDAVFSGRRTYRGEPVHLAVEASVTIDRHDVRRARQRAELLARVVGTEVIPVVAGAMVSAEVVHAAQEAGGVDGHRRAGDLARCRRQRAVAEPRGPDTRRGTSSGDPDSR